MLEDPNRRIDLPLGHSPLLFDWNMDYPNSDQSDDDSDKDCDDDHKHYKRFFDHRDGGTSWSQHFRSSIQLSVKLRKSSWLNATIERPARSAIWSYQLIIALVIATVGTVIFSDRRMYRPLATLTNSADAIGRGENISDLEVVGPHNLRQTINAFNRIWSRLNAFDPA